MVGNEARDVARWWEHLLSMLEALGLIVLRKEGEGLAGRPNGITLANNLHSIGYISAGL